MNKCLAVALFSAHNPALISNFREFTSPKPSSLSMDGYAKLATFMGAYPEVAIFRRFAALNTQNILYLQAELIHLETTLRELEKTDKSSGDAKRIDCAFDWLQLRNYVESDESSGATRSQNKRWKIMSEIRTKLEKYSRIWKRQGEEWSH